MGRCRRQTPTARGECRWNAEFRAVAEGGTKRRLERERVALNARRNGLNFTLRFGKCFENFKQGSDRLERVGLDMNIGASDVLRSRGEEVGNGDPCEMGMPVSC